MNAHTVQLGRHPWLSESQKTALKRGNIHSLADLILRSPQEIAGACRIPPLQVKELLSIAFDNAILNPIKPLEEVQHRGNEVCTSGDSEIDKLLGGGIRAGMIWDIAGESAAGKTQFALQLSLCIQLPVESGGLNGSACYLTTSSQLPTRRLLEISQTHDLLSSSNCNLENIHTLSTTTFQMLLHALTSILPDFISKRALNLANKPVKLIVIDALAELFHYSDKTNTSYLAERSQRLNEISLHLHSLASKYQVIILVLNEVVDSFDRDVKMKESGQLLYAVQSRWFGTSDTVAGENKKQVSLGLSWANQVNARILLSRTSRRRYLDEDRSQLQKRRKVDGSNHHDLAHTNVDSGDQWFLIRRFSVIFSSVCKPASLDYVVTSKGISSIPSSQVPMLTENQVPTVPPSNSPQPDTSGDMVEAQVHEDADIEDEWDRILLNDNTYDGVDWDVLEQSLTQAS